jgi:UDP-N-acetylmuramoyl-L-alanyl-D-glutamate--2,6-diaminopimelate ligase
MTHAPPSAAAVRLRALFSEAAFFGASDIEVVDAAERSDACRPGSLFAAIPGTKYNGAEFLADAVRAGAAALLLEQPAPQFAVPQCVVPNVREAYARLCAALHGNPSRRMDVVGVTGTNGKTTVAWLIRAMLRQSGRPCGLLGTVEYDDGRHAEPASLTTPDARSFSQWLARMAASGTMHAAVELSSHALHQGRVAGTELAAAAVTNITHDHFDYHKTFAHYQSSKGRILELLRPGGVVALNRDDAGAWGLRERVPSSASAVAYSLKESADVWARIVSESLSGIQFRMSIHGETVFCETPLIGRHNVENCLAAAAVCASLGVSTGEVAAAIRDFRGAPGRLERVHCGQRFEVFVDYAHTDDALRRCLNSLRSVTPGRLICVFGAGGDRDRTKRPLLGRASQLADLPIVTSDNPRSEPPERIAADLLDGFDPSGPQPVVELDRARAIRRAMRLARPGDSVLIAGKGHENEQIFHDRRIPFDDRREARQALLELLAEHLTHRRIGA